MTLQSPQPVIPYGVRSTSSRFAKRIIIWVVCVGIALFILLLLLLEKQPAGPSRVIFLSQFQQDLQNSKVAEVTITDNEIYGAYVSAASGSSFRLTGPSGATSDWEFIDWILLNRNGANVRIDANSSILLQVLLPLVPWILIFGFVWFFVFRVLRRQRSAHEAIPVYQVPPPIPNSGVK